MKLQTAASAIQPKTRLAVSKALDADDEVVVPQATPVEAAAIQAYLKSSAGKTFLAKLAAQSAPANPTLQFDAAT